MTEILRELANLEKVEAATLEKLKKAKEQSPNQKVGFVSGIVVSEGPGKIVQNLGMLARYTRFVRRHVDYPVFSAIDFLEKDGILRLVYSGETSERFWRDILHSGYITDIFMTPGWLNSKGATNEYHAAVDAGVRVHRVSRRK